MAKKYENRQSVALSLTRKLGVEKREYTFQHVDQILSSYFYFIV
jgi:hypothetical protein